MEPHGLIADSQLKIVAGLVEVGVTQLKEFVAREREVERGEVVEGVVVTTVEGVVETTVEGVVVTRVEGVVVVGMVGMVVVAKTGPVVMVGRLSWIVWNSSRLGDGQNHWHNGSRRRFSMSSTLSWSSSGNC